MKIATVVAARPRGGSRAGRFAPAAAWAGLAWPPWPARAPRGGVPPVGADDGRRFAVGGVAVQMWGGSVIFDPVTWAACPGGEVPPSTTWLGGVAAASTRAPVQRSGVFALIGARRSRDTDAGKAMVTEHGQMTRSQSETRMHITELARFVDCLGIGYP